MYKALLVDRNMEEARKTASQIKWEEYGYELAGIVSTGKDTYEIMAQQQPELILTEIHFTDSSGFDLMEAVHTQYPDTVVAVLSSYAEFAYAQKALEYGAAGYYLKPVNQYEIHALLEKVSERLKRRTEQHHLELLDYLMNVSSLEEEAAKSKLLRNGLDLEHKKYWCIYFNGANQSPDIEGQTLLIRTGYENYLAFMEEVTVNQLQKTLRNYLRQYKNVYIGISGLIETFSQLKRMVRDAKQSSYNFFCQPDKKEHIFFHQAACQDRELIRELSIELGKGVKLADFMKIERLLGKIEKEFITGNYYIGYAVMINDMCETYLCSEKEEFGKLPYYEFDSLIKKYGNISVMLQHIKNRIKEQRELAIRGKDIAFRFSNQTFQDILVYIHENYNQDLPASFIAEKFHINQCYLSQLFKKEMGETFTEYLRNLRIQSACKLLTDTSMKVGEIAEAVGFRDYFYFSRIFKKIKDMTPTAYRNSIN